MKKVCFVCPTVLLKRPIADIIKNLNSNEIGLFLPKKIFKDLDDSLHYSRVYNAKIYNYSIVNPPFVSSEFSIPVNPLFIIYLIKVLSSYNVINMWVPFYICNTILAVIKKIFFPKKKLILTMDTIPAYSFKIGKIQDFMFKLYYQTIGKIIFSACDKISLYGKSMKKYAIMAGIPKNKIIITPTGVNIKIRKQNRDIRKELNIRKDEKIILFVGLLNPRKGIDTIIKIAQKMKDQNVKIIIVGDSPKKKKISKISSKKKITR